MSIVNKLPITFLIVLSFLMVGCTSTTQQLQVVMPTAPEVLMQPARPLQPIKPLQSSPATTHRVEPTQNN